MFPCEGVQCQIQAQAVYIRSHSLELFVLSYDFSFLYFEGRCSSVLQRQMERRHHLPYGKANYFKHLLKTWVLLWAHYFVGVKNALECVMSENTT